MDGTITALEVQKRDRERVNVYIDGQFAFGLDALEASALKTGQTLTPQEIAALKAKDAAATAYKQALGFLSYRIRSSSELRDYLRRKRYDDTLIEEVIGRLTELNYLNDLEFARTWVRNREEFHPRGASALRYELRQKGISSEIIDEALAEFDPFESAYHAAQKKARSLRGKSREALRQQIGGNLMRRGYDYTTVNSVLERLIDELEADNEE
ncbi:MAG: RecX family transcriptional regulator [Anaerolineae bacterium]|nr:MAG: RecX family transcriptional regulator [Anaerolineae bacterium]